MDETRYECPGPGCPKTYLTFSSAIRHGKSCSYYNGHFGIEPIQFWCAGIGCEKNYSQNASLVTHQRTCSFYLAEKPFEDPPFDQNQPGWTVVFDQGPTVSWRVGHLESEPPTIATILRRLAMENGAWDKLKHDGDLSLDFVLRFMNTRNLGRCAQIVSS